MIDDTSEAWQLPVLPDSAFDPNFDKLDFKSLAESEELSRLCYLA